MMLARKCAGVVGRSWRSRVVQTSGAAVLLRSLTAGSTQSSFRVRETQSRETCLQSRENRLTSFSLLRTYISFVRSSSSNAGILKTANDELKEVFPSKAFVVVHISGKQFKVAVNDLIVINRIPADVGAQIYLDKVLLAGSENVTLVGTPMLSKDVVRVSATVIEHNKTAKVIVFKKKRRKNYKRKKGHRQDVSVLRINSVELSHVPDG